jgi:Nucleotide modification associated domain 2
MGGSRLNATGQCVFAMQVTAATNFDEYWTNPTYNEKKPVRNGSRKMMVGDNIYHREASTLKWQQADSHHSHPDGSVNVYNLDRDTRVDRVLISGHFFYFGKAAPRVPQSILDRIGYRNPRSYRRFDHQTASPLLDWLQSNFPNSINELTADPFDFAESGRRYSGKGSKII